LDERTSYSQVNVENGGQPKVPDERDRAAIAVVGIEPGSIQQMARDHALHHLQHRRDQIRPGRE